MATRNSTAKTALTVFMVVVITLLHYFTKQSAHYQHMFYQELYFVPLVLAAFWFGLRGALITSVSISLLYLPFIMMHWSGFSPEDFNRLLEIVLYNAIAATVGILRNREQRRLARLREAESLAAMGRALSGAAHDMKTPLIPLAASVVSSRTISPNTRGRNTAGRNLTSSSKKPSAWKTWLRICWILPGRWSYPHPGRTLAK